MRALEVRSAVEMVLDVAPQVRSNACPIVAVSGIDGSGKGFVSALMEQALVSRGVRVATIHIDGWLNLPSRRFDPSNRRNTSI